MILKKYPELNRLTAAEKLTLISELWEDLAADPESIPVSPEQVAELDRRMDAYRKDPSQVTTWEKVRARLLGSRSGAA